MGDEQEGAAGGVQQAEGGPRRRGRAEEMKALKRSSSPAEKAMELLVTVKNQLVEFSVLPQYLQDNNYILGSYRVNYPFKRALLSVFSIHNETFNVWTYVRSSLSFATHASDHCLGLFRRKILII